MDEENEGEGVLLPGIWPEPIQIDGLVSTESPLTQEQERRAAALYAARAVLERRGMPFSGKDASIPPAIPDLIRVANYVLHGREKP